MTEDEMVVWHHRVDGHEFEQIPRGGEGQGGLVYYNLWGRKELDTTEQLNTSKFQCQRNIGLLIQITLPIQLLI